MTPFARTACEYGPTGAGAADVLTMVGIVMLLAKAGDVPGLNRQTDLPLFESRPHFRSYDSRPVGLAALVSGDFSGCGVPVPLRMNFMKSDSARREGWTSFPTPKNRQKLMISGRHFTGSICGRCPSPPSSDSSTCTLTMCTSKQLAETFFPNGRQS